MSITLPTWEAAVRAPALISAFGSGEEKTEQSLEKELPQGLVLWKMDVAVKNWGNLI